MSEDFKRLAPITHAENAGAGRWFVLALLLIAGGFAAVLFTGNRMARVQTEARAAARKQLAHTALRLKVTGMECSMCEIEIQEKLGAVPGVKSVKADHETGDIDVVCDGINPARMSELLAEALAETKYRVADAEHPDQAQAAHSDPSVGETPQPR